jgi:hypothetical protein
LNENSWNNYANMLYIDQPVQAGFSYDVLANMKLGLINATLVPEGEPLDEGEVYLDGTFSSQNPLQTANTTANAARVLWNVMQAWMAEPKFSDYRRDSINLWAVS